MQIIRLDDDNPPVVPLAWINNLSWQTGAVQNSSFFFSIAIPGLVLDQAVFFKMTRKESQVPLLKVQTDKIAPHLGLVEHWRSYPQSKAQQKEQEMSGNCGWLCPGNVPKGRSVASVAIPLLSRESLCPDHGC